MNKKVLQPVLQVNEGKFNTVFAPVPFDLLNPTPEMIDIRDIANALAKICRFGGNIPEFYSVAQHSVMVANIAPKRLKKAALLHDASEAYCGDVIKPLKVILGKTYDEIEERVQRVIFNKFKIPYQNMAEIKEYDIEILELENERFYINQSGFNCFSPWLASIYFMKEFFYLFPEFTSNQEK